MLLGREDLRVGGFGGGGIGNDVEGGFDLLGYRGEADFGAAGLVAEFHEDVLGAGALYDFLGEQAGPNGLSDSARIALELYRAARGNLVAALGSSRNGRRLLGLPELSADVEFCAQRDIYPIVTTLNSNGMVQTRRAT